MRQKSWIVVVGLACWVAQSKSGVTVSAHAAPTVSASDGSAASVPITFGDLQHEAYFNLQAFLVRNKLPGETPQTWEAMTVADRASKVQEGEAFLSKKRPELLAKLRQGTMSDKEKEFLAAVWPEKRRPSRGKPGPMAGKGSPAQKYVASVAEGVGHVKDWGLPFDGGGRGSVGAVDAGSAGAAAPESREPVSVPAVKDRSLAAVPPPSRPGGEAPGKSRAPLAGGALACAALAAAWLGLRRKAPVVAAARAEDEFPAIKQSLSGKAHPASRAGHHPCGATCHPHHGCGTTCHDCHDCGATCTAVCGCTCTCTCVNNCGCTSDCGCTCNATCNMTRDPA